MDDKTKAILLALECLLKTVASNETRKLWKLPEEKFEDLQKTRETYIAKTTKLINDIVGEK